MVRARFVIAALLVVMGGMARLGPHARAQSASVQAQSLFDDGLKLLKAGKIAEACAAFESSHKLDPAVTTLLNVADCRERNHQLATAWGAFVEANRMARATSNAKLAKVASNHVNKLEPRLSRLTIAVPPGHQVTGLEILRGSEPVNPAGWNHALPIDGGTYTITARAPGFTAWSVTRTIKNESDAQVIEVPRLVDARPPGVAAAPAKPPPAAPPSKSAAAPPSKPAPVAGPAPAGPAPAGPARPERTGGAAISVSRGGDEPPAVAPGSRRAPGVAPSGESVDRPAGGSGRSLALPIAFGAGTAAFGGLALWFNARGDDLYHRAMTAGEPQRTSLYNQANNRRYAAEALLGAAIGCAGAAVYFYLRGGSDTGDRTAMTPLVSPQLAGVALVGHW